MLLKKIDKYLTHKSLNFQQIFVKPLKQKKIREKILSKKKICIYITCVLNMGFQGYNLFLKAILCNTNEIPKRLFATKKVFEEKLSAASFCVYDR